MGTLRGACVQAMLWHSLGRALVALWQQCLLRGARLRRGARAILHDRRPAKMVCDCCDDGQIPFQVVRFYVNSKQWWDLVINQVPQNALEGHRR